MNILHTSDWHLGQTLYGKKRLEEFRLFLDWLKQLIIDEHIDVLLVSGDIFDSALPSNHAQALYYRFLCDVSSGPCRHIVLTAGNHDSPSFLDAPRALLNALDVQVIGNPLTPEEEVLTLRDAEGEAQLLVCAVPFLRDRDLFRAVSGDTFEERDQQLAEGLKEHYRRCADEVTRLRSLYGDIPSIAMGHLFAAGSTVAGDDGVRDLRIGSLGQVDASVFPSEFDYVALGHLHIPQIVAKQERIRYSGSPLPMGFGEADQQKKVFIIGSQGRKLQTRGIDVPLFQKLEQIAGDWDHIVSRLEELSQQGEPVWVEVLYTGPTIISDLAERVQAVVSGPVEILRVRNALTFRPTLMPAEDMPALEDMDVHDVFEQRLSSLIQKGDVCEKQVDELRSTYAAAVRDLMQNNGDDECAS
ncbi:MAG: exonuclease SbcCD subunit D C-terminal domain-containing protein [Mailhella sp.]|nr:exonuclease SbcCD subunit D C-terminal domain-containing protein [Mailhella sp.]